MLYYHTTCYGLDNLFSDYQREHGVAGILWSRQEDLDFAHGRPR